MHVRFVKWARSVPPLVFNLWFIVLMTAVLFVDIVNGQSLMAFICLLMIGFTAALSASMAHAHARTRRMEREVMSDLGRSLEHHRRCVSDCVRELARSNEYMDSRRSSLNATLPGDVGEVIDQARVLVSDWADRAALGGTHTVTTVELAELLAFIEIAAELAAPEEQATEITLDEAAGQVVAVSTPSSKDRTDWIKERYTGIGPRQPIDPQ